MKVLNLRGLYCLKNNHITLIILALWLNTTCVWYDTKAQFYKPSDKTVRMGETLPDSFYQTIHQAVNAKTGKTITIQLKDYKNKLIILDFWATWCGPCIYSLNKLDSTKKAIGNDNFVVIPVTYQNLIEATPTFNKHKWNMTSIIGDTTLAQIFPHSGMPHQVWIKDGKVVAIPWWTYATGTNILKTINGEKVNMAANLQDQIVDPLRPIFVNGNGQSNIYYKTREAIIARYTIGYTTERLTFVNTEDSTFLYCVNNSLKQLLYAAFKPQIFPALDIKTGISWNLDESVKKRLLNTPPLSRNGDYLLDSLRDQWLASNMYGYSLRHQRLQDQSIAFKLMQQHLQRFFGLYLKLDLKIEKRLQKYLVLRAVGKKLNAISLLKNTGEREKNDSDQDYWRVYNRSFRTSFLMHLTASAPIKDMTIIDSTGIDHRLMVDFITPKKMLNNLKLTQESLAKYGLSLEEEELWVPVLVVTQKNRNK